MKVSIIIPVYNSEKTIGELVSKICDVLSGTEFEIVLVDDGSRDASGELCDLLSKSNNHIVFISLRKNFGEHNAVMCGLFHSRGNYCVIMDDDLQNPPSEILKLMNEMDKGFDVVYSKYLKKKHHLLRNIGSYFHNRIANFLLNKPKKLYLSSFKIVHRNIVNEIIKYEGPFPYIDGLIWRTTHHISSVYVEHNKTLVGKTRYTPFKLISLFLCMFLNFSVKPLRFFTFCGFLIFTLGVLLSGYFIFQKVTAHELPGWTSTVIFILLLSGFQIIFLGVIGEYLGKQYLDQNKTPQWVIKKRSK